MVEDWLAVISNMNGAVRDLRQAAPEVIKTFGDVARAAHVGNALDDKTKELRLGRSVSPSVAIPASPIMPRAPSSRGLPGGRGRNPGHGHLHGRRPLGDVRRASAGSGGPVAGEGRQAGMSEARMPGR